MGKFDLIVFGATGFTGKFVAAEVAKVSREKKLSWAIGGRSQQKLEGVNSWLLSTGAVGSEKDLPPILLADCKDSPSLETLCAKGKVLINCTGPFRFYGESVVSACISSGCSYVDITGEPEFIERMRLFYHQKALDKGVLVVNSCGFDSVPADIGSMFNASQFPESGGAASIEAFIMTAAGDWGRAHVTTLECAVHGFSNQKGLKEVRKQLPKIEVPKYGPRLRMKGKFFKESRLSGRYCMPWVGSDASVVRSSQQQLVEQQNDGNANVANTLPFQFGIYGTFSSWCLGVKHLWRSLIFVSLVQSKCGQNLLLKYPRTLSLGFFTHEGPTMEELETSWFELRFFGKGYSGAPQGNPNYQVETFVRGPEAGYVATPIMVVQCALRILEKDTAVKAGVVTTATAFRNTQLIPLLQEAGIKFGVIKSGPINSEKTASEDSSLLLSDSKDSTVKSV
mmetsp:Transcript_16515/g.20782  ORF Transcript_16515/g.20782 Transcript_16515/m.20782 type:complete len:452 (-) Transcript_16515:186-1541(-)